ncbi:MAG: hypothetical protein JJE04_15405 [Acidobacteriia bacterium]|nr:hypothetical protein [Terriglobia bacterium]
MIAAPGIAGSGHVSVSQNSFGIGAPAPASSYPAELRLVPLADPGVFVDAEIWFFSPRLSRIFLLEFP